MNKKYTTLKNVYKKNEIRKLQVFFDNQDYITFSEKELIDFSVKLYDKLISTGENYDGYAAFVAQGEIKLKVGEETSHYRDAFVYDHKEYRENRKAYIERRTCQDGGMVLVKIFNEYNWSKSLYGNMIATMDGEYLLLTFLPKAIDEPCESEKHYIYLNDIKKSTIRRIKLDFENCESCYLYRNEIAEIKLTLSPRLEDVGNYRRGIQSGYLLLKLDETIDFRCLNGLGDSHIIDVKGLTRRICDLGKEHRHDICHLNIEHEDVGYRGIRTECLSVKDIKSDEEIMRLEKQSEEDGYDRYEFEGGYAKREKGGYLRITFGETKI